MLATGVTTIGLFARAAARSTCCIRFAVVRNDLKHRFRHRAGAQLLPKTVTLPSLCCENPKRRKMLATKGNAP
jgi:hypothetical protein